MALSLLVAALSFGKISIGFSFALVVGFSLFASNPRDWRTALAGSLWATFFFFVSTVYSMSISVESNHALLTRFQYSWQEITSALLLLSLGVISLRFVRINALGSFVIVGFLAFLAVFCFVFFAVPNSSDSYFFSGLFSVLLLLGIFQLTEAAERLVSVETRTHPGSQFGSLVGAASVAFLLLLPVSGRIVFSPFHGNPTPKALLAAINDQTYMRLNSGLEAEPNYSVRRAVQGIPLPRNEVSSEPFAT